jgi:hypothetical protein
MATPRQQQPRALAPARTKQQHQADYAADDDQYDDDLSVSKTTISDEDGERGGDGAPATSAAARDLRAWAAELQSLRQQQRAQLAELWVGVRRDSDALRAQLREGWRAALSGGGGQGEEEEDEDDGAADDAAADDEQLARAMAALVEAVRLVRQGHQEADEDQEREDNG